VAITILAFIPLPPAAQAPLRDAGYELHLLRDYGNRDALIAAGRDARIVVTNGEGGLGGDEIDRLPELEHICAIGVGFENIDLDRAAQRGISVTNGRGANAEAVADHTLGLMLAASMAIPQSDAMVRAGHWAHFASGAGHHPFLDRRRGITGKGLGILGLGLIGQKIAERGALGFAMPVAYHSRRRNEASPYRYMASVSELAEWSDFLVVATPGGAGTRHLVDRNVLEALGHEGILVNIGRGSVVDTAALIAALQAGTIRGAALDVVEGEPSIPDELLPLDNLVITPHMAGRGPEPLVIMADLLARNVAAFLNGDPLLTPVLDRDGTRAVSS
jgi:lactate dehydrogenase-like 2-hydroxyacid dehydrogenase